MNPEEVKIWAGLWVDEDQAKPPTWDLNSVILRELASSSRKQGKGRFDKINFIFATDRDFSAQHLHCIGDPEEIRKIVRRLSPRDRTFLQINDTNLPDYLREPALAMMELQGVKNAAGRWLHKGPLSGIVQYMFGNKKLSEGWYDDDFDTLEVRSDKPKRPVPFIAECNKMDYEILRRYEGIPKMLMRYGRIGHRHLHIGDDAGIFTAENIEDLKLKAAVVAQLCWAHPRNCDTPEATRADYLRSPPGQETDFRPLENRIEARNTLDQASHPAFEVYKIVCNAKYALKNPEAEHLPVTRLSWRPKFNSPDNSLLHKNLNKSMVFETGEMVIIKPKAGLFQDAGISLPDRTKPKIKGGLVDPESLYITCSKAGKINVRFFTEDKDTSLRVYSKALEDLMQKAFVGIIPTISCVVMDRQFLEPHKAFEQNPAYQSEMPPKLWLSIANALREKEGIEQLGFLPFQIQKREAEIQP